MSRGRAKVVPEMPPASHSAADDWEPSLQRPGRPSEAGARNDPVAETESYAGVPSDISARTYGASDSDVWTQSYQMGASEVSGRSFAGMDSEPWLQSAMQTSESEGAQQSQVGAQSPLDQSPLGVPLTSSVAAPQQSASVQKFDPGRESVTASALQPQSQVSAVERSPSHRLLRHSVEALLSLGFEKLGWAVGSHPWIFLLAALVLTIVLGSGLAFLLRFPWNMMEMLYLPVDSRFKTDQQLVQTLFSMDEACNFSIHRQNQEVQFASILVVSKTDTVLDGAILSEIREVDDLVQALSVTLSNGTHFTYQKLCAKEHGFCVPSNPLLFAWRVNNDLDLKNITYPIYNHSGQSLYLTSYFGGNTLGKKIGTNRLLLKAKAMQLLYFLITEDKKHHQYSKKWLIKFLDQFEEIVKTLALKKIQVVYFTSISNHLEFEGATKASIPLFYLTFLLMVLFVTISCYRVNCIQNKMWVAPFGVISVVLAMASGFGLMLYSGVPLAFTVANAPFLILGIGVGELLIMVSAWQKTSLEHKVEERMATVYSKLAVPFTVSTVTNVLAIYTGAMIPFKAVQCFCIYTGTSLIFCYIYSITCFGAMMALDGKREAACLQWVKKSAEKPDQNSSSCKRLCCCPVDDKHVTYIHPMNFFFRDYFSPFLVQPLCKVCVVLLYVSYVSFSLYGCFHLQAGLDLPFLAHDVSYIKLYFKADEEYFSHYGPRVMVIVNEAIDYWDQATRKKLESCLKVFEGTEYVDKILTEFWLPVYLNYLENNQLDANDKNTFINNIELFLQFASDFKDDVNISRTNEFIASRGFLQTINVYSSTNKKHMLSVFRSIAKSCEVPLMVFSPLFAQYEQYNVIIGSAIKYVIITTSVLLLLSLFLIPYPLCAFWVAFAFSSMTVGVTGFTALWSLKVESISVVSLIICIGFSFGFSHIACAYLSSSKPLANQKSTETLYLMGYPVLQRALSIILSMCLLSLVTTYLFRTFLKSMLLVVVFGAAHGLIFIPVFLTFF